MTKTTIRILDVDDLGVAGRIIYRAFGSAFRRHGYPEPVADIRAGVALAAAVYEADPAGSLILESEDRRPLGIAFFQRSPEHTFIGPLAVDPDVHGQGHGRRLLAEILRHTTDLPARLLQDSFNPISFRLYAHAGFEVRETMALLVSGPGGPAPAPFTPRADGSRGGVWSLRDTERRDLPLIAEMDHAADGIDRTGLLERISSRMRGVILDGVRVPRGFACAFPGAGVWVVGPGWAEDGRTLAAVIVALAQRCVRGVEAVALFAPASRADLISPLLDVGFRVSHLVNLMVRGAYDAPRGAYLPVIPVDTAPPLS